MNRDHSGIMAYDFSSLSHNEFEDLTRDLIGREIGKRFEAFPEGPDSGMDGRHASADGDIILQAKHYHRSGFSHLKATMAKEGQAIQRLQPKRYILATSTPLTPKNKSVLSEVIGPALQGPGDIFGPDDLNALLRKYPDIETVHQKLWIQSTAVLGTVLTEAVEKALAKQGQIPAVLADLLPSKTDSNVPAAARDTIFLIKASPIDDEFALWLAPKLEAEGYRVFADILTLQPGDRWRREINQALQYRAAKILLVCRDATLADQHVQDDLDIALEMAKELGDTRFIIPMRLEQGKKVKGVGDAVTVDFVRGWGEGVGLLLDALQRQRVLRAAGEPLINPNWEIFRRRGAIPLVDEPERLTSNWLRVAEAPDFIRYFEGSGVIDDRLLDRALEEFHYPAEKQKEGIVTFADQSEVDSAFASVGRFRLKHEIPLLEFIEQGHHAIGIDRQVASNLIVAMIKKAWLSFCRETGFVEYYYSNGVGVHASAAQVPTGHRIPWGKQGDRRSSMLRNVAKGHIWQFGLTAMPYFWPFWHMKLKSRVLFSIDNDTPEGLGIDDVRKMHRLRRNVCKGWRNKQWHGRMLAFLELLSGDSAYIRLSLATNATLVIDAAPMLFTSPVSTALPDVLDADEEEADTSTLGRPDEDEVDV
ncbi:toll/interleukin-1 receptor domain-containing protein [Rhodopseudomonas palustris]|uniref:toll/interleukin-1 receptor domain-containing protein n=1 Tax=Rhodopseudomonas palustris TaxID=1076 RepID=UPI002ACEAEFD|nr:toll/interleukin-1 receptor domain-containing protein [Rhodopseudomonas palustris]WQH00890.1 toll/interleukin-1 receptor domain-containing protein [Rhodopseudomonas palustris]